MRLADLIGPEVPATDKEIRGLAEDSRKVRPGYLFAALAGTKTDGARFIDDALSRGAVAVLTTPDAPIPDADIVALRDPNPRRRFAALAARFYGPQPDTIVAVTGTNGKTSVASFTRQIWEQMGHRAASIGTLGVVAEGLERETGLTTPDIVTLHETLRELREREITHVACEASSHGLVQYRLDGLRLAAAAYTNLSRDHMDYHATVEDYFFAKARLFGQLLPPGGVAVINMDDPFGADLEGLCWARGHRLIRIGHDAGDIRLLKRRPHDAGQELTIGHDGGVIDVDLPLVGEFQALNALTAAALVIGCGGEAQAAFRALEHLRAVPGRMELVSVLGNGARVYVDYAHTPDALKTVLQALRPHVQGRLVVVFGCGGDRDRGKRPLMGAAASEFADKVYVTDDNPRSEEPAAIRAEILKAAPGAVEIGDRAAAIAAAMRDLQPGDMLVVAGKGHERGQIIKGEVRDFSDFAEVRKVAAAIERGGGQ